MTVVKPEGGVDAQYQKFLADGQFMIQRGVDSGTHVFSPREVAPGTGEELAWVKASGFGTVYSVTTVHAKPPTPSHNISLIDLDEGPRMMSNVVDIDPDRVTIGMRVQAKIVSRDDSYLVVFSPAK